MSANTLSQLAAFAVVCSSSFANAALYDKVISTNYGNVVGYQAFNSSPSGYNWTNWKDITVFKGIPFAATTGGANRWKAPQPVTKWNSTFYACDFGPVCPSATSGDNDYTINEDCLNLNIWTPAKKTNAKLPVVMWSYPAESTARDALFDGGGMAHKGIVFVNYNHRTGVFGWLSHPTLSEEFEATTGHNSSGNWGMLDQFAALKWIRENIQSFGGDPDHITVMGQSAGSAATYHILNSALTKGDIVGAIVESGVRDPHDPECSTLAENYITLSSNLEQGVEYLASLNVSTIAEARAINYTDLVSSSGSMGGMGSGPSGSNNSSSNSTSSGGMGSGASSFSWTAVLDYYAMPGSYYETLVKGASNQVPVLTGNTKDESGATYGLNITVAEYLEDLEDTFNGTWLEKFTTTYGANDSVQASGAENAQWTDRSKIGTWFWTQLWKTGSSEPVYNYFWDHTPPGQDRGAYHESEINYVLNNLYGTDLPWEAIDYTIAEKMNGYWSNFIKNGNPNGKGLVKWPSATDLKNAKVQHVGDGWGQVAVASAAKVKLFKDWFATLTPY